MEAVATAVAEAVAVETAYSEGAAPVSGLSCFSSAVAAVVHPVETAAVVSAAAAAAHGLSCFFSAVAVTASDVVADATNSFSPFTL